MLPIVPALIVPHPLIGAPIIRADWRSFEYRMPEVRTDVDPELLLLSLEVGQRLAHLGRWSHKTNIKSIAPLRVQTAFTMELPSFESSPD
jgi:hypothetical protein